MPSCNPQPISLAFACYLILIKFSEIVFPMKRPYILWADDDEEDLELINEILQELNLSVDVVEVNNGRQALDTLHKAELNNDLPCLIILDVNMPVLDGKQTLIAIKKADAFKNIPVVAFTTSSSELDKRFFRQYKVEMLTKPPKYGLLKQAIQRLITFCN